MFRSETLETSGTKCPSYLASISKPRPRPSTNVSKHSLICAGDFWGPLIFCLLLATALSLREEQSVYLFTLVFIFVWGGASVVYANAQLLGVPLSFMHTVCRLGYALSPLAAVALTCTLLLNFLPLLGTLTTVGAGSWSLWAGSRMIWEGQEQHSEKKYLALYPVLLYYLALTSLCILS